jgi:hypothetical protein
LDALTTRSIIPWPLPLDLSDICSTLDEVEYVEPPPPWEEGRQGILNALEAQMPEHTFKTPVPVVARIVWEYDGVEHIETEALGWTGQTRLHSPTGSALSVHGCVAASRGRSTALTAARQIPQKGRQAP